MAFNRNALGRQSSHANVDCGVSWDYKTPDDNAAAIAAAGYFNGASDVLEVDDLIFARSTDAVDILRVTAVDAVAGTVTVAAQAV